jgi:hypothetical protein
MINVAELTTTRSYSKIKGALPGVGLDQWVPFAEQTITPLYRPLAERNVMVVWPTANAMTTAPIDDDVIPFATALREQGWKVLVPTNISCVNGDAGKNFVNAYYDTLMASATPPFDGLVDLRSVPQVSTDGAYLNTTYYSDQLHPTPTAYTLMAPVFTAAINALG